MTSYFLLSLPRLTSVSLRVLYLNRYLSRSHRVQPSSMLPPQYLWYIPILSIFVGSWPNCVGGAAAKTRWSLLDCLRSSSSIPSLIGM